MAQVHRNRAEEIALGMTLLGVLFSSILFGITLSQIYTYFKRFPRDSVSVKVLVIAIAIFDTASVVLVSHAAWYYFVTTGSMKVSVWSLNVELALSMFISGIAELFLTYRVWMLSNRRILLTYTLCSFALLHFGEVPVWFPGFSTNHEHLFAVSGLVSAAQFLALKDFAKFDSAKIPSILRLSSAAICDTGIAISLCYFLQQKRTGYKKTDEIIDHLMIFSINSGLLTSLTSISCLVTYLVVPKTWVYHALCFLISRLYGNTFLCALNTRQILQTAQEMDTPVLPQFRRRRQRTRDLSEKITTPTQIGVLVVTETFTRSDLETSRSKLQSSRDMDSSSSGGSSFQVEEVPR
ncbi:hypothetical protein WG66_000785 [Moniliophthora roreri]|nr:hypothetical protein WG66_000785 [Moniliophthora roreri]